MIVLNCATRGWWIVYFFSLIRLCAPHIHMYVKDSREEKIIASYALIILQTEKIYDPCDSENGTAISFESSYKLSSPAVYVS
jgi:hypothetical protein